MNSVIGHQPLHMKTVGLIGVGGIGSRLLQSLLKIHRTDAVALRIVCCDTSSSSIELARERMVEVGVEVDGNLVSFVESVEQLPSEIDLAIIATTSAPRFSLLTRLLDHSNVGTLLLEKFLFVEPAAYDVIGKRLLVLDTDAYVHAPRPAWPGYIDLSSRVKGQGRLTYQVTGSDWAMASNAVHFIAAFLSLIDETASLSFDESGLDREPHKNKRDGYLEVTGRLSATSEHGDRMDLVSYRKGSLPLEVGFHSNAIRGTIREAAGIMELASQHTNWTRTSLPFTMLRASEMEGPLTSLLTGQPCRLPRFDEMARIHRRLIPIFNHVFFGPGSESRDCPVT